MHVLSASFLHNNMHRRQNTKILNVLNFGETSLFSLCGNCCAARVVELWWLCLKVLCSSVYETFQLFIIVPDFCCLGWNFCPQERGRELSREQSISNNPLITNYFHIAWTVFIFHKLQAGLHVLDVLCHSQILMWVYTEPAMSCCRFCCCSRFR